MKKRDTRVTEPEWASIEEEEEEVANYGFQEEEEEEEEKDARRKENELYCVACRKKFKSEKQWENHEQSKKHREKVAKLKVTFNGDDERVMKDVMSYKIHTENLGSNKQTVDDVDDLCDDELKVKDDQTQDESWNESKLSILRKRARQSHTNVKARGSSKRKKQSVRIIMVFAFLFFLVIMSFYFPYN